MLLFFAGRGTQYDVPVSYWPGDKVIGQLQVVTAHSVSRGRDVRGLPQMKHKLEQEVQIASPNEHTLFLCKNVAAKQEE